MTAELTIYFRDGVAGRMWIHSFDSTHAQFLS